ncbi:MAG TPA: serine/threonine-protein kinase [Acidobacteriaceae bacterium]
MALETGQRVGDYEILSLLGAGGMGRVYRVRNIISDRIEAMKVLLPDYASERDLAARFMAEIRTLAGLEHPNIAQLRTAFQFENQIIMVMEFVEGATLENLGRQGPVAPDQLLEYASQVLGALSYAHSRGVTHRDIKPANIMITAHGLAKLMDFGIAKSTTDLQLTRPGTTMGSVYYMSPEQVRGGTVDARSDIYSFGITLYEMLAGRKPFQADTAYSVLNAHLNEAPVPPQQINPQLPAGLNEIVMRAIAKAPADRFQTADDFRNAIRGVQQQRAQAAAPTQTPQSGFAPAAQAGFAPVAVPAARPAAAAKSQRGLWIGVGVAVALLALIGVAIVLPHVFATHAGQRGQPAAATETAAPQNSATQPASAASPAASPSQQNPPAPPADQTPMAQPPVQTRSAAARSTAPARTEAQSGAAGRTTANRASVPAGPSAEEIHQAHNRIADLNARAAAAKSGVESIRRQQQAQGYDLRGDVLAAMNRLEGDMHAANQAVNGNDLATANQSMDSADQDLAVLEKFLGQ